MLAIHLGQELTLRPCPVAMLAWMGGKRSILKHARKQHNSKIRLNSSSTTQAEAGSKRPLECPANKTRVRPAKRTKEGLYHDQRLQTGVNHKDKEPTERGEASASSSSSDLQNVSTRICVPTSEMGEQAGNASLAHLPGKAAKSGTCVNESSMFNESNRAAEHVKSQEGNVTRTRGPQKAAHSANMIQ
ncbi:hypothetical protein ABBQ32_012826 [Trebouxia sp. C0010 RCD-2024]